jgi:hypothetical protein
VCLEVERSTVTSSSNHSLLTSMASWPKRLATLLLGGAVHELARKRDSESSAASAAQQYYKDVHNPVPRQTPQGAVIVEAKPSAGGSPPLPPPRTAASQYTKDFSYVERDGRWQRVATGSGRTRWLVACGIGAASALAMVLHASCIMSANPNGDAKHGGSATAMVGVPPKGADSGSSTRT